MKRRIWRIFPPYWAALVIIALVLFLNYQYGYGLFASAKNTPIHHHPDIRTLSKGQVIGNITLTETWRPMVNSMPRDLVIPQAWSLCYEEQFYLICGLLLLCNSKRFFTGVLLVSIACFLFLPFSWIFPQYIQGSFLDGRWLLFALGVLVYYIINYSPLINWKYYFVFLLSVVFIEILVLSFLANHPWKTHFAIEFLVGTLFAIILFGMHRFDSNIFQMKFLRPLFFLGKICYSLYLVHYIITEFLGYQLYSLGIRGLWPTIIIISMPISTAFSIIIGWIFYTHVESKFLNSPQGFRFPNDSVIKPHLSQRINPSNISN